jgi:dienelactone hydrolase
VDGSRIAVHGRSLGAGVAVQVAAARPLRCAVLTSPFSSALSVAQAMYPWLPVSLLMRHPFDSLARAPSIRVPVLFLVGSDDSLIRPAQSWRLADAWGGAVERRTFDGFGHNDVHVHPDYDRTDPRLPGSPLLNKARARTHARIAHHAERHFPPRAPARAHAVHADLDHAAGRALSPRVQRHAQEGGQLAEAARDKSSEKLR